MQHCHTTISEQRKESETNNKSRNRWFCRRCKKTSFGSKSRADEASGRRTEHHHTEPQRAYPCPVGNGWHLTSEKVRA